MRLLASAAWDGANADEIRSVAPERYEGTYESSVLVRNDDGDLVHVRPGWTVSAWDGARVMVSSPAAWGLISSLLSDLAAARGEAA